MKLQLKADLEKAIQEWADGNCEGDEWPRFHSTEGDDEPPISHEYVAALVKDIAALRAKNEALETEGKELQDTLDVMRFYEPS